MAVDSIIMTKQIHHTLTIPEELEGLRLDQALAKLLPDYSRTQIKEWITSEKLTLNDAPTKPRTLLRGGEIIQISAEKKPQPEWEAQSIPLEIIYEDDALLVINKPAGMVVHPAAGNFNNTLLNALLHHAPELKTLPRAGIVHRLDKDTSGLLVIAKTEFAIKHLSSQLTKHTMHREYQAIICGLPTGGGKIDAPIGRHPISRKKMAVQDTGKEAITHYRVIEKYRGHTRLKIQLETGRTHQIRVHLAHIRYPIFGDPTYGKRLQLPKGASAALIDVLRKFKRQALHAFRLELIHPVTEKSIAWEIKLPEDMQQLVDTLKKDITP